MINSKNSFYGRVIELDYFVLQIVEGLKTSVSLFDKLPAADDDTLYLKRAMLINQTDEDKRNLQTMIKVFVASEDLNSLRTALEYSMNKLM